MTYRETLEELLDELNATIYWLNPCESDYFNQGVAETMVLDAKKEIYTELTQLLNKYYDKYAKAEE